MHGGGSQCCRGGGFGAHTVTGEPPVPDWHCPHSGKGARCTQHGAAVGGEETPFPSKMTVGVFLEHSFIHGVGGAFLISLFPSTLHGRAQSHPFGIWTWEEMGRERTQRAWPEFGEQGPQCLLGDI